MAPSKAISEDLLILNVKFDIIFCDNLYNLWTKKLSIFLFLEENFTNSYYVKVFFA